jgi:hypothetical protein
MKLNNIYSCLANRMKNGLWLILVLTVLIGCKKEPKPPTRATLTFPAQNALCTSGTVLSTTESSVVFTWDPGEHADSYGISVKNLVTGTVETKSTSSNQATYTLLRNTPYSWFVVSKSSKVIDVAQSDVWKFYLAGLGVTSYSPFPATITAPTFGQVVTGTTVNLAWTGSDVDNDISGYEVYFGTAVSPPLLNGTLTAMFLNGVSVSAGNTYYWRVVTRDLQGNRSDSGIYQFKVN